MDEFLVPMSRMDWGFFDRQRSIFKDLHTDMGDDWLSFDSELDRIKRDMFTLSPMDFGDFGGDMGSGFGKSDLSLEFGGKSQGLSSDMGGMSSLMDSEFKKMEREMDQEMGLMGSGGIGSKPALSLTGSSSPSSQQKMTSTSKSSYSSKVTETSSSSTKSSGASQPSALTGGSSMGALTSGKSAKNMDSLMLKVDNPIVAGPDGKKRLTLRFDVSKFKPEEISVKTVNRNLTVHAKHTEESPGKKIYREFSKQYILPKNIDPLTLTSTLARDGVLQIEGPAPDSIEAPRERLIPVLRLCV